MFHVWESSQNASYNRKRSLSQDGILKKKTELELCVFLNANIVTQTQKPYLDGVVFLFTLCMTLVSITYVSKSQRCVF